MITATATGPDGKRILMLGITRENIKRLIAGQPIRVGAESHPGFPEDVMVAIFFGETERDITEALKGLIGPDTKVVAVPREKPRPT